MTKFLKTQQTMFLICHLKYSNHVMTLFFKKNKTEPIFETTPQKNIPNITEQTVPKTEDFFIDDDEFDEYKKPETISINNQALMTEMTL